MKKFSVATLLLSLPHLAIAADPEQNWEKSMDLFFGEYVVAPLASLLFWPIPGIEMPLVVAWLLGGAVFFTIKMRFVNLRLFKHAIDLVRGKFDDPQQVGEVSHFQALTTALSATVGLGNIAGVAIAIGTGGPGATFWMILVGFLGMSSNLPNVHSARNTEKFAKMVELWGGRCTTSLKDLRKKSLSIWEGSWLVFFVFYALEDLWGEGIPSRLYNLSI